MRDKTSDSNPLSGRVVLAIAKKTKNGTRAVKQATSMGILRMGQDAIPGVVRLDFLSSQPLNNFLL